MFDNDGSGLTSVRVCLMKQCSITENKKVATYTLANENKKNDENSDGWDGKRIIQLPLIMHIIKKNLMVRIKF